MNEGALFPVLTFFCIGRPDDPTHLGGRHQVRERGAQEERPARSSVGTMPGPTL